MIYDEKHSKNARFLAFSTAETDKNAQKSPKKAQKSGIFVKKRQKHPKHAQKYPQNTASFLKA